ncbi:hypothetical protein P3W33_16730 [Luteibacter sp. PPL552]
MRRDADVRIALLPSSEGGPKEPIPVGVYRGLMMFERERGYDFRADILEPFCPGETRELPIAFLSPEEVAPRLVSATRFVVWNGRTIGEGEILASFI